MAKFSEFPQAAQLGIILTVCLLIGGGYWYMSLRPVDQENTALAATLKSDSDQVNQLQPYEYKLPELNRAIENLNEQLERQKLIVPDERDVPSFLQLVQAQAAKSNVGVRGYHPKDESVKDYYVEMPFDLQIDGPYYRVLDFFQKLAQQERIVSVAHVKVSPWGGGSKAFHFAPNTSINVSCEAKTYYSSAKGKSTAPATAPAPAPVKK